MARAKIPENTEEFGDIIQASAGGRLQPQDREQNQLNNVAPLSTTLSRYSNTEGAMNQVSINQSQEFSHHPAHSEHLQKSRQYYRDMMLGVNDGIVSTFLLVSGVVGGGMVRINVLMTAISGAVAGAISMFAGEYVATKSQNEVMNGEIKLEHEHVVKYHAEEMQELSSLLSLIGIPPTPSDASDNLDEETPQEETRCLNRRIQHYYEENPDALLKIMKALELGVIDEEVRSPIVAGGASLCMFFIGTLPSTIPFAVFSDPMIGLIIAGIVTGFSLIFVGAVKTWATRGNLFLAAFENLIITATGGALAYGIGVGFQKLVEGVE